MSHRSLMLDVAGAPTHLVRGGHGPPLLVLHPEFAPGCWFPYHEALASRFHLFAPDHPGFGKSARADWVRDIDDVVLHYADLLDTLGLEHVAVLGTSVGGWIAAELAVHYPRRVSKLILAGAAGLRVDGVERYDVFLNPIEETLGRLFHDPGRAAQLLPADIGHEAIVRAYHDATALARLAWDPYFYNPKLEARLRRITAPTLVVWGREDRYLPIAHGEAYARGIANARLEAIADCGHLVPLEQTARFVDLAMRFLTEAG